MWFFEGGPDLVFLRLFTAACGIAGLVVAIYAWVYL
jgi:hypothetical protein